MSANTSKTTNRELAADDESPCEAHNGRHPEFACPMRGETVASLRRKYAALRGRSHCECKTEFDAAVKAEILARRLPVGEPASFVKAAESVTFKCRHCAGTGQFITGSVNGRPTGPGGICFRCEGKGVQNDADARRNFGADLHQIAENV